jgi:AraC-like DNA-binding protein/mannose-6-phosphate isomerase-like protein (cupin superfamily)
MSPRTEPPILQETLWGGDVGGAIWPFQPLGWQYLRPLHLHDQLEVLAMRRGSLVLTLGRERVRLRRGQLAWIAPSVAHRVDQLSEDVDFWSIQIEPWLLNGALSPVPGPARVDTEREGWGADNHDLGVYAGLVRLARELPDPPLVEPKADLMDALERAAQTAWAAYLSHATKSPASDSRFGWMPQWHASSRRLAREGLIAVLHAALAATRSERAENHDQGLARLAFEALLSDPALSRRQLCDRLGSSEGNLSRRFPDLFGVSLVQQRARLRLVRFLSLAKASQASNLLRSSLEAGFGSYAQLHRVFWQHSSCTPSDYLVGDGRLRAGAVVRVD